MQAVILCGGKGTRLREKTESLPKPLVEIGPEPIVWHVMRWYAHYGVTRFLLATGYQGNRIVAWVADARRRGLLEGLEVDAVDTGLETMTGGRVHALRDRLCDETFCCTYADGLTDLRLGDLLQLHQASGRLATLTAVRPRSQFGILQLDAAGRIGQFIEKPLLDHWINGGFFVFEPGVLDYLTPDCVLEREPFEQLAAAGQFGAYRHEGFWACMDTYKDHETLDGLWRSGQAPWQVWG